MLTIYVLTIFASAVSLFLLQPMFARMVLPMLGGSPAVWNTALVFYQAVLLAGYAYAHFSIKWLGVRRQAALHLGLMLLPLIVLPIGVPPGWKPPAVVNPVPWLLALMAVAVSLPFFVVSTGSPLLQNWFASTQHRASADPYFLYAASNLGSMLALLIYPTLVEPHLRLTEQSWCWAVGYGALILMTALCALALWRSPSSREAEPAGVSGPLLLRPMAVVAEKPASSYADETTLTSEREQTRFTAAQRRGRWVMLAFVPSSLMVSVTTYLTTDIAAVPLLWIIPLAIYLLTFILVFTNRPPLSHMLMVKAMPLAVLPLVIALMTRGSDPISLVVPLHLGAFFLIAMVCHGELSRDRPPPPRLTEFYLLISVGGVLGGAFNALLAPLIFHDIAEYPIVLTMSCLFLPWATTEPWNSRTRLFDMILPAVLGLMTLGLVVGLQALDVEPGPLTAALMFGVPSIISFSFSRRPLRFALAVGAICWAGTFYLAGQGRSLHAARSFFGAHRVTMDATGRYHQIMHGSTLHGSQSLDPARRRDPVAYYFPTGPVGQFFHIFSGSAAKWNVALVGLGVGGITCYAQPGQNWTIYEIDPLVERIARDPRFFSYLEDCPAKLNVVLGDGRLSLAAAPDRAYELLILDAYSSDSVPVHLLTREALEIYLRKLAPRGILMFNISNRYLDLEPVLGNLARSAGLFCLAQVDTIMSKADSERGKTPSHYVLMARASADLDSVACDRRWRPARTRPDLGVWTDDYSSILSVVTALSGLMPAR